MTSTRLPGKVLADLAGEPLLAHMIARVRRARRLAAAWVATTVNASDDPVAQLCDGLEVSVFRGDEMDVLARYAGAAAASRADPVVRLTADCPMIDPGLLDEGLAAFAAGDFDYFSNAIVRTFPDGLDFEIFTRAALDRTHREAQAAFEREHVTPYMRAAANFRRGEMRAEADFGHLRWTVDTREDLDLVRALVSELPRHYRWLDVVALLTRNPRLLGAAPPRAPAIRLRPATASDCDLLFEWVNRPDSLASSLVTQEPVSRAVHEAWFAARLHSADAGVWIALAQGGKPVGQVRLEQRDGALDVSLYVEPHARGQGTATAMLAAVRAEAARRWPALPLRARIKPDNWSSRRLFARAGYGRMVAAADHIAVYRDPPATEGS